MLDHGHGIVITTRAHGLDAGTETGDGQYNDVSYSFSPLHASELFEGDILLAVAHIEIGRVVEEVENGVCPHSGTSKIDDTVYIILVQSAFALAPQCLLGDASHDLAQDRMTWFRLYRPLTKLNTPAVPVGPILAIWICFDTND